MAIGQILSIGGSLLGGLMGKNAAEDAAEAQQAAAMMQAQMQREIYDETTARFNPFYEGGLDADRAMAFELGLAPRPSFGGQTLTVETVPGTAGATGAPMNNGMLFGPAMQGVVGNSRTLGNRSRDGSYFGPDPQTETPTQYRVGDKMFGSFAEAQAYADANSTAGTEYRGFKATPSYDFRRSEGLNAIDNSAASRGGLFSGATMKAAQQFGDGLAASEYTNFLNRLTQRAGQGQAAAGNMANAGANYASGAGAALGNFGNAGAAGAIGGANALMGGINNAVGMWNYQNTLNGGASPTMGQANNMLNQNNIFSTGAQFV